MTWLLAAVSITATILTGRKVWWGWLVVCASCVAWATYGLVTNQYGFAALQTFYVGLTAYNARRWWRERRTVRMCPECAPKTDHRSVRAGQTG